MTCPTFERLKETWRRWEKRNDLVDYVIGKGADFTVRLIRAIDDERAKRCILAALFDKGSWEMTEDVRWRIDYDDYSLGNLAYYRPELAGSPEKSLQIFSGKIKDTGQIENGLLVGVSGACSKLRSATWLPHSSGCAWKERHPRAGVSDGGGDPDGIL